MHLSCSPNFLCASYLNEHTLMLSDLWVSFVDSVKTLDRLSPDSLVIFIFHHVRQESLGRGS